MNTIIVNSPKRKWDCKKSNKLRIQEFFGTEVMHWYQINNCFSKSAQYRYSKKSWLYRFKEECPTCLTLRNVYYTKFSHFILITFCIETMQIQCTRTNANISSTCSTKDPVETIRCEISLVFIFKFYSTSAISIMGPLKHMHYFFP